MPNDNYGPSAISRLFPNLWLRDIVVSTIMPPPQIPAAPTAQPQERVDFEREQLSTWNSAELLTQATWVRTLDTSEIRPVGTTVEGTTPDLTPGVGVVNPRGILGYTGPILMTHDEIIMPQINRVQFPLFEIVESPLIAIENFQSRVINHPDEKYPEWVKVGKYVRQKSTGWIGVIVEVGPDWVKFQEWYGWETKTWKKLNVLASLYARGKNELQDDWHFTFIPVDPPTIWERLLKE